MQKTGEDKEFQGNEEVIRTYITHNKGGKWELLKAPEKDSNLNFILIIK